VREDGLSYTPVRERMLPISEQVEAAKRCGRSGRPPKMMQLRCHWVSAHDIDGEGLVILVVNKLHGLFESVAVKAPIFGTRATPCRRITILIDCGSGRPRWLVADGYEGRRRPMSN
jgi:hypothetical protein